MPTVVTHRYAPRGACREVFHTRADEVLLSGPAGTGKSRACLEKLHAVALKYPGSRGLIVRKTATSLTNTALVTWREKVVPEALAHGVLEWYGGSAQEAAGYRYGNGSVINVGGMDRAERIMSSDYDVAYAQEATELTVRDWEVITTRLRNGRLPYQQLTADCNPQQPSHWLKVRCDEGRTRMLHSRHEDNPLLFDDDGRVTEFGRTYIAKLDALTGVRKPRLRHGLWVAAEGVVYEDWNPAVHVIDSFEIPVDWPRYWAVDFGFTNPFVCQWWAEDPDGRLYLYRELYRTQRLVEDHARDMLSYVTDADGVWTEPRPRAVICDHDAEGRATLERHLGIRTTAANKTVTTGLQAVQGRLRAAGDGKPRLLVLAGAPTYRDPALVEALKPCSTVEEFPGYVWAPGPDGRPAKEEPLKEDDHGLDATRYLVMARDGRTRGTVRWL